MKSVPAAEANRHFSRLLREVQAGASVTITSHGRPVARLVPAAESENVALDEQAQREAAKQRLLEHLSEQKARNLGPWTRDELYEDDA